MNNNPLTSYKKRVVILYKYLPQWRRSFFEQLKVRLNEKGVQLDVYYGKLKNEEALRGDEVDLDWAFYRENKILKLFNKEIYWQPVLKDIKKADLVIAEQANKLIINYLLLFIRKISKLKFAFWGHGTNMQAKKNSLLNIFKKSYTNNCDWWFAYTKGVAQCLQEGGFPAAKITVVQNSIDSKQLINYKNEITPEEIKRKKAELGLGDGPVGIFSGGLVKIKGIDLLIEACELIKNKIPDFEIIILGSGALKDQVEQWAAGNNWVHYVGPKFDKEKVAYFRLADILMMPGLVGLVIIDSFIFETPLFTTMKEHSIHSPEIEYFRNNENGMCSGDDVNDYAEMVINTLNSPNKLNKLKSACKADAEIYTLETMVDNFYNGIVKCLEN